MLDWTFSKYSDLNSIQFVVQGLSLLVALPLAFHFWKINDCCVAALGIVSRMTAYLTLGLSNSDAWVYSCKYASVSIYKLWRYLGLTMGHFREKAIQNYFLCILTGNILKYFPADVSRVCNVKLTINVS